MSAQAASVRKAAAPGAAGATRTRFAAIISPPSLLLLALASPARQGLATDVAQLQLDGRPIDLALRIRFQRRCVFRAGALRVALRNQRVAANLMHLRGECAGLLDVQRLQRLIVLAGLNQQARQPQTRDLRKLFVARRVGDVAQMFDGIFNLPASAARLASSRWPCWV